MIVDVVQEGQSALDAYAGISIAFEVREVFDVTEAPLVADGFNLTRRVVDEPWMKDYDAGGDGGPAKWPARFDLTHWAFFGAHANGTRVGSAAVALRAPDIEMLEGRPDVALLWDIRVAPSSRGQGVGASLLGAVEAWASAHAATWLEVETQNINAPACRFYRRNGFVLHAVDPHAYPLLPNETQLLWYKKLDRPTR